MIDTEEIILKAKSDPQTWDFILARVLELVGKTEQAAELLKNTCIKN